MEEEYDWVYELCKCPLKVIHILDLKSSYDRISLLITVCIKLAWMDICKMWLLITQVVENSSSTYDKKIDATVAVNRESTIPFSIHMLMMCDRPGKVTLKL